MNFLKGSLFRRNTEPEELEPERPQPASRPRDRAAASRRDRVRFIQIVLSVGGAGPEVRGCPGPAGF